MLPRKRITVNLAPADVPKADSGFDLAIAVSILVASGQSALWPTSTEAFIGELGLDGSTRAVRGIIGKLLTGRARGVERFYIPAANLQQAQLVPHIELIPVNDLVELYQHLAGLDPLTSVWTGRGKSTPQLASSHPPIGLSEVVGQDRAKRALEIAAAGGHNVLLTGPPGTGKSMLAKALASVLPPLTREEMLEVTHLHSLAGHDYDQIVSQRPFRSPHHSASYAALTGGGSGHQLRPGEITLAHRGVLFLDELPEFQRPTLEALRQPLEDRTIIVARAQAAVEYPADFILVATANPCPCGFYGSLRVKTCTCNDLQLKHYRDRLSGPILDRIDLFCTVSEVYHDKLLTQPADPVADDQTRQRIQQARQWQTKRYRGSRLNAAMTNADLKRFGQLEPAARRLMNTASRQMNVSARAYMRTAKVARTIADLDQSDVITTAHVSEALSYRAEP